MRRTIVALGITGALALAGCGSPVASPAVDVADAVVALQLDEPSSGDGAGDAPRRTLRQFLRKNTLHGEVAIQTRENGVRTVVVQRGSVTAVTAGGVSVKSSDGFALTWTFGEKLRVVQDREEVEVSALKTGADIGIAGVRDGDATTARLIALR